MYLIREGNVIREQGPAATQRAVVCRVDGQQLAEREQGAYATLFAAAPDLLEALKAILTGPASEPATLEDAYPTMTPDAQAIIDRARAAIAKASGE